MRYHKSVEGTRPSRTTAPGEQRRRLAVGGSLGVGQLLRLSQAQRLQRGGRVRGHVCRQRRWHALVERAADVREDAGRLLRRKGIDLGFSSTS